MITCECGNPKDKRSKRCARCTGRGFAKEGAKGRFNLSVKELRQLVKESASYEEVASKTNVSRARVTVYIKKAKIPTSHFRPGRGRPLPNKELFVKGKTFRNGTVKKRLIEGGFKKDQCERCGQLTEWNGKPLTIELHHKNGDSADNRRRNLELLCPNCHTQTGSCRGRKKGKHERNDEKLVGGRDQ